MALLNEFDNSTYISLYVIAAALITLVAVGAAQETRNRNLSEIAPESGKDPAPGTVPAP